MRTGKLQKLVSGIDRFVEWYRPDMGLHMGGVFYRFGKGGFHGVGGGGADLFASCVIILEVRR